ncbi:hypothetical protein FPV67DRAFT_1651638 [Lyophyllum atratum]|nr:hypothetical protein FPV67DRAFT_1651638 [Lyophyllum atratum]
MWAELVGNLVLASTVSFEACRTRGGGESRQDLECKSTKYFVVTSKKTPSLLQPPLGECSSLGFREILTSPAFTYPFGDMSKFPPTTELVVGQGTVRDIYPASPNGSLLESDFRSVTFF